MPDSIFCPKCGTPNQPDFMYCTSCGFALSTIGKAGAEKITPPPTTPVYHQPAVPVVPAKAASGMPRWLPAVIVIVVLAGIGFLIWNNEQSKNSSGKQSGLTGQNDDGITVITDQGNKIKLKDFAGVWRAYESNDPEKARLGDDKDDLFIEVSNGRIAMYPRSELDKEDRNYDITCDELIGNSINCIMKSKEGHDGSYGTIKLELQPSKNDMTVTITQSQSSEEKLIVKARRLNEMGN